MLASQPTSPSLYFTIDCEFTEEGLVRELVILLYKEHQVVRALEVFLSPSGSKKLTYHHQQINYHVGTPKLLNLCIDYFLKSCLIYGPLSDMKLVGMSLEHDLKSILNTTKAKSMLRQIPQKTQLEMCGRGTLETKAQNHKLSPNQIGIVLSKLVTPEHAGMYRYHTALYDAIVTGYVYLRVTGHKDHMGVHNRFKKCTHTHFDAYYKDMAQISASKKKLAKQSTPVVTQKALPKTPKNFPELRYRVQKKLSNVLDIVAREMFHEQLMKLHYEPTLKKIEQIKTPIMEALYPVKQAVAAYDTPKQVTDPYNHSLVQAGVLLVKQKITLEDFIDFAIYMQQYNLPSNKGTYYKVSDNKKEIYVRCLQESTAKKLLYKKPYATIDQFLRKKPDDCRLEILD